MDLFVLGSGTCVPTIERGPSGLALTTRNHLILFDGGGGSLRQLPSLSLDFRKVDFYCITHFHPDHVTDLVPFLFASNYTVDFNRTLPLRVIGPRGLKSFYEKIHGAYGVWIEGQTYPLSFHELWEDRISFEDLLIETLPMTHGEASVGFRLEADGKAVVYSGDTQYCDAIVRLGRQADLLILECSFPQERKRAGHLTPPLAGKVAQEARCRRLLLTHFYPVFQGHDIHSECRKEFSGEIILAEDGMKLSI